jgi:hypothetical protein
LPDVADVCAAVARDNVRSTLSRAIGKVAEAIATDCEAAIAEDGSLADLSEIWNTYVTGLDVDLDAVAEAPDWEARVEALRLSVAQAVHGVRVLQVEKDRLNDYVLSDPRLEHLHELVRFTADDPGPIPAHLVRGEQTTEVQRQAEAPLDDWDDEPPVDGVGVVECSVEDWDDDAPAAPKPAFIPDLLTAAGVQDGDAATVLKMTKSYYSMIKNRKRPWPGLKPDQVRALRGELQARADAAKVLQAALNDPASVNPDI